MGCSFKMFIKNLYVDKLVDIVKKCNNTCHSIIKMNSVDVKKKIQILTLVKRLMIKILNLNLLMLLEYQNGKPFLKKVTLQIG